MENDAHAAADLELVKAQTIRQLIDCSCFDPQSVVNAVQGRDMTLLTVAPGPR